MKKILYLFLIAFAVGLASVAQAQTQQEDEPTLLGSDSLDADTSDSAFTDSIEVSLITCGPGERSYELYGHSAIHVNNLTTGEDLVYNFGVFSFNTDNFFWKFMLGKTDYSLAVVPFNAFVASYAAEDRTVSEQVFNYNQTATHRIDTQLRELAAQPNWTYRYNMLYDNCTTRARDMLISNAGVQDEVTFFTGQKTYRVIIHAASHNHPWQQFLQDLVLGADADREIPINAQFFSPLYALMYAGTAEFIENGEHYTLVKAYRNIYKSTRPFSKRGFFTPNRVSLIIMILVFALTFYGYYKGRKFNWLDDLLLLVLALLSIPLTIFVFFSDQPTTGSNCLIWLCNPLLIFYLPFKIYCNLRHKKSYFGVVCLVLINAFIITNILSGQIVPLAVYVYATCLLIRATMPTRVYVS